jgi:hypothetical protein
MLSPLLTRHHNNGPFTNIHLWQRLPSDARAAPKRRVVPPSTQVSLAAQLSLQGSPATVSVSVVSVQQVAVYMQNNTASAVLSAAALPTPTSDGTYRIYKCDFSNYEQVRGGSHGMHSGSGFINKNACCIAYWFPLRIRSLRLSQAVQHRCSHQGIVPSGSLIV